MRAYSSGDFLETPETRSGSFPENASRNGSKPSLDTELYPGRNITRTERLKQMREAQKKLHKRRNGEIERLRQANALLRKEIANWKGTDGESVCFFRDEDSHYKMMQCADKEDSQDHQMPDPDLTNVKRFRFVLTYDFNIVKKLYFLEKACVGSLFISKLVYLITKMIQNNMMDSLRTSIFRYYQLFTMLAVQGYLGDLTQYTKNKVVPGHWLWAENYLPRGNLLIVGMFKFLVEYSDLERLNVDILTSHLIRYAYATINGPAVCVEDLLKCVQIAYSTSEMMFLTDSETNFMDL